MAGESNFGFSGTSVPIITVEGEEEARDVPEERRHADEATPLSPESRRSSDSQQGWDVFVVTPRDSDEDTSTSKLYETTLKLLKVIAYLATFSVVLSSATISKGILLFMTSVIGNDKIKACSSYIENLDEDKIYNTVLFDTKTCASSRERIAWIWSLFLVVVAPDVLAFMRSARICLFKTYKIPTYSAALLIFATETMSSIGTGIFVFVILPSYNVITGAALSNCLCLLPAFLVLTSKGSDDDKETNDPNNSKRARISLKTVLNAFALLFQVSGLFYPLLVYLMGFKTTRGGTQYLTWLTPLSLVMMSFGWTENFVEKKSRVPFVRKLAEAKENLHQSRYFLYIFISLWKILLVLATMFTSEMLRNGSHTELFTEISSFYETHRIDMMRDQLVASNLTWFDSSLTNVWLMLTQVLSTWICYIFSKFACKICIQAFSFTLPLKLAVPCLLSLLSWSCFEWSSVNQQLSCNIYNAFPFEFLPKYLFWSCLSFYKSSEPIFLLGFWLLWFLSQIWVTTHLWIPTSERLATTEKLFVAPMYSGAFIDQSLIFNRRRDDEEIKNDNLDMEPMLELFDVSARSADNLDHVIRPTDKITRIYACATMWHESTDEMVQMLKSIMRMDEDQCARENAQKYLRIIDLDYYKFETHIFFDDAFQRSRVETDEQVVNQFVKQFLEVMDTSASMVHKVSLKLRPPKKIPTPYGGRLEWTLPGKTKLIAHLKDKSKIRHRKRWSQVMYMYYLLGHRLMEQPMHVNRKVVRGENTYLLALDGDIDFQPHAVRLLVDLMKKNKNLGAACGRIHPIGSGYMMWYQKFEYAISHWLQKAAEHIFGCVLCSPGCFSLFRARALMSDNVMNKYTMRSEEPLHYVQFDQGEDRWLCTLLLKSGYRVEYNAASDAYTHCPESFGEFYTQRRRWAPSTLANVMDLLQDYKHVVRINRDISMPYIIYQGFLMVGTVLGPATILLMLVGAMNAVFGLDNFKALIFNLIPVGLFILVCFKAKNNLQIYLAQIMSAAYALLMLAVLIGTVIQMTEEPFSPSTIFFILLLGSFFIAAILHPTEFTCVLPFLLYMLCIPSMYMLLTFYSMINLNVVTWGTREVAADKTPLEVEQEKKAQEALKDKGVLGFLTMGQNRRQEEGEISFGFGNMFRCLCCTREKVSEEKMSLIKIEEVINEINTKVTLTADSAGGGGRWRRPSGRSLSILEENSEREEYMETLEEDQEDQETVYQEIVDVKQKRDQLKNPFWVEDKVLQSCSLAFIPDTETPFWQDMIAKYLYPIEADLEHEKRVATGLKDLRNKVVFGMLMLNSIFVLLVFMLQMQKEKLSINLPAWGKQPKEGDEKVILPNGEEEQPKGVSLEPVGSGFIFLFAIIMVTQFIGMILHRFSTFSHILAFVELNLCSKTTEINGEDEYLNKNAVQIAKNLQCLQGIDEDKRSSAEETGRLKRQNTIYNLERRKTQRVKTQTLDVAFRKRFMSINSSSAQTTPILGGTLRRRQTVTALERRRNSMASDRSARSSRRNRPPLVKSLSARPDGYPRVESSPAPRLRAASSRDRHPADGQSSAFEATGIINRGFSDDETSSASSDEDGIFPPHPQNMLTPL